jgi:hypothetical protein
VNWPLGARAVANTNRTSEIEVAIERQQLRRRLRAALDAMELSARELR